MIGNKSRAVRELVGKGDYQKALSIVRGFRLGIGKEDLVKIRLAHECFKHPRFYEEIGTDTTKAIDDGIHILVRLYGQGEQ